MPNITFRAKVEKIYNMDDTLAFERIKVPSITRSHCDMAGFRNHKKIGAYANSDLFKNLISTAIRDLGVSDYVRLDKAPPSVAIDTSGFLAKVTITVPDNWTWSRQ